MRWPLCIRLIGCLLLGGLFLCPSKVCGQVVSSSSSSLSKTLSINIPLGGHHALVLSTEYVRSSSFPKPLAEQLYVKPAWRFKGIPITLGYSYALRNPNRRIVPVVSVGASLYFSSAKQLSTYNSAPFLLHSGQASAAATSPRLDYDHQTGMGYGAHISLGLRADVNRYLFVLAEGRARYVNGLAFTGGDYNYGSEFSKLDFALGFGFKF